MLLLLLRSGTGWALSCVAGRVMGFGFKGRGRIHGDRLLRPVSTQRWSHSSRWVLPSIFLPLQGFISLSGWRSYSSRMCRHSSLSLIGMKAPRASRWLRPMPYTAPGMK